MTHVYDRLHCAPKLALQSPTPGCGKTTFLDCLSNVVCRPEPVSGVGAGAFVRLSDEMRPTWLLDEADRLLNPKNTHEALTAAINAQSYRRLARMQISVPTPDGGWRVQAFEFWCPMLLAGIKRLVDTVQDRSIVLMMSRARPGELRHRLINGTSPRLQQIQRKFVRWAQDLAGLDPTRPCRSSCTTARPTCGGRCSRSRPRLAGAGRLESSRLPGTSTASAPRTPTG